MDNRSGGEVAMTHMCSIDVAGFAIIGVAVKGLLGMGSTVVVFI